MFFIFKIFPDWFWWLLLVSGLASFFASYLPQVKTYHLIFKISGLITIAAAIFILGMLHSDNVWKSAAAGLEAKVTALSKQSEIVNTQVKEKTITKLQIVKLQGQETIKYIDREVAKFDNNCTVPQEFVVAHNRAAEAPK